MAAHISKKAFITIGVSLVIIFAGYFFYKERAEKEIAVTNQETAPIEIAPATLEGTFWIWERTELIEGKIMKAANDQFVLTFDGSNRGVTSTTDCNSFNSTYVKDGEVLSFAPFGSTKMFCENTQEGDYSKQLSLASSYMIFNDRLYINLNRDFGTMVFRKK